MNRPVFKFEPRFSISDFGKANYTGIYCVLADNEANAELLYIGIAYSQDIGQRINGHEKKQCWERMAEYVKGEKDSSLWFITCESNSEERGKQLEAALIFRLQPFCNINHRKKYEFPKISATVQSSVQLLNIDRLEVENGDERYPCGPICEDGCFFNECPDWY